MNHIVSAYAAVSNLYEKVIFLLQAILSQYLVICTGKMFCHCKFFHEHNAACSQRVTWEDIWIQSGERSLGDCAYSGPLQQRHCPTCLKWNVGNPRLWNGSCFSPSINNVTPHPSLKWKYYPQSSNEGFHLVGLSPLGSWFGSRLYSVWFAIFSSQPNAIFEWEHDSLQNQIFLINSLLWHLSSF